MTNLHDLAVIRRTDGRTPEKALWRHLVNDSIDDNEVDDEEELVRGGDGGLHTCRHRRPVQRPPTRRTGVVGSEAAAAARPANPSARSKRGEPVLPVEKPPTIRC